MNLVILAKDMLLKKIKLKYLLLILIIFYINLNSVLSKEVTIEEKVSSYFLKFNDLANSSFKYGG